MRSLILTLLLLALGLTAPAAFAQEINQSRGRDAQLDYLSLDRFGPWDDRNYELTRADLALLAPDEEELADPIPAFFRVAMRRAWPELRRSGPGQYPRSALQIFRQLHTGYQVKGKFYRKIERVAGRFRVVMTRESEIVPAAKFLDGEARVTSPEGAAESAIKINPVNTNLVIAGSNGPGSGQKMHYSTDGGANWNAAAALPQGGTCCDPTVDWKSDGSLAHTATLGNCSNGGCAIWYYRSSDGGKTWNDLESVTPGDPRRELTTSGSDKEFLHVDQYASSPHLDNVYLTWHDGNVMQFARSTDDGNTWSKTSFSSDPQGIGSDITTDKNGHVYYFWPAINNRQIVLKKSTNGGASFGGTTVVSATEASFDFPIPAMDTRRTFVYVAADTDLSSGIYGGSIYVAWTDSTATTGSNAAANHGRIQVAYSRNGGASWTVVTPHETGNQSSVDRFHPWLAVGPDGKVHVAFYDTRRSAARTSVDLYYSSSVDGGQTFSTPTRLTAQQSPKINDSFEWGDYNGLDAVMNDVIAIFTDNRREGGGSGDSVDVYSAGLSPGNRPQVTISSPANGTSVTDGTSLSFAASATDTEDGNLTSSLAWTSSLDGSIGAGGSFSTALSVGSHTVTASATDSDGLTGSSSITVTVTAVGGNTAPQVSITAPAGGSTVVPGQTVNFSGGATDAQDGNLTSSLSWTSSLAGGIGGGGSFSTSTLAPGTHTITASVVDSGGLTGSASISLTVAASCNSADFSETFESGADGWTTGGLWHLTQSSSCAPPGYSSATHAMYFGQDAGCDYDTGATTSGNLVSPQISGVSAESSLSFAYFRQVEKTSNDPFETVSVAVSVVGQSGWTTVWSKTSLEVSENAWTTSPDLSLASYAGQTIQLRFRFDSVDEVANGFVGWLVDDVKVTGAGGCGPEIFSSTFESGDITDWSPSN